MSTAMFLMLRCPELLRNLSKQGENLPETESRVHVYASAREFVVVPVMVVATEAIELAPVERVKLVIGRATTVALTRALRDTRQRSAIGLDGEVPRWDGDNGRWRTHNLLFVTLRWDETGLTFARQERSSTGEWETIAAKRLPGDTPLEDLAAKLIEALGEQLDR
jgi:hypothetical protein